MTNGLRKIELLAPAKNLECGIAAIDHGADAVYIGAAQFGARQTAGNSTEDIAELTRYAHQFGAARRAGSHDCGDPARLGGETHLVQICPLPFAQGNLFQCEHASSFASNSSWGVSHLSC